MQGSFRIRQKKKLQNEKKKEICPCKYTAAHTYFSKTNDLHVCFERKKDEKVKYQ